MLVWALCTMSNGLIPPIIDAATVRMTRRNGSDFGVVRAWATVGYVIGAGGIGALLAVWGAEAFVPLFVAMSLLRALLGLLLPRFRAPEPKTTLFDTPSELFIPAVVTRENIKAEIFDAGINTPAQVCTGEYVEACRALGILE